MAVSLPNGVTVSLATTYDSDITITSLSNANPALATATGHGLIDDDIVEVTSGWSKLNNRVVKVDQQSADTFQLLGINSTDTGDYPAGTGTGTVAQITAWTQITQIMGASTSGGEMQFVNYSFLEMDYEIAVPTQASPMTLSLEIADDPALAGYIAVKAAAEARATRALKIEYPSGAVAYYNGIVSFNETPTFNKNQIQVVTATFNLQSRPVRYSA